MDEVEYSDAYKRYVFSVWYTNGRKNALSLYVNIENRVPDVSILETWIQGEFKGKADELDELVTNVLADSE